MKYNKQILEAINRGIQLALDDYEDDGELTSKSNIVKNLDSKKLWNFYNSFADLGLPSGTLWCKYNLGCDWDKLNMDPEHAKSEDWYGNYYAWGEIEPKKEYSYKTYKFRNSGNLTKYNKVGLTELQLEDDAAYQFDNRMKIPTKEQFEELLKYATNEWIRKYQGIKGLSGMLFTSKINGNQLFIPASGYKYKDQFNGDGFNCNLWSSSRDAGYPGYAWSLYFNYDNINLNGYYRARAFAVRPVLNR